MTYSEKILNDYSNALHEFESALTEKLDGKVYKAGYIQYFEFCFELAWKSIKVIANDQGIQNINSPKACLKEAFKQEWINDEEVCLEMLNSRNIMVHTYSERDALIVYERLDIYLIALKKLFDSLKSI